MIGVKKLKIEKRYTAREVADLSGYSLWNIQKFAKEGELKGFKTKTNRWRFFGKDVQDFLDKKEGK